MDNRQRNNRGEPGDIHHHPRKRLQGHSYKKENEKEEKCMDEQKARKAIRKKTKTWKKYRQTGNAEDHERYRKALNKATKTVKKAKGDFEIKLAAEIKNDSKSFFSYARSKLRTKEQIGPLRDTNGNLIEEPKLMAILLNEFFSSVFTTEDLTNIPSLECQVELMADITIGAAEVQRKLQDLRTDKAPGADLVHPRLLKELAVQVAYPLAIIFQQSIDQSRVPQQLRTANVIPIFKKGSKRDAANYRPISLTSHIGKLLESLGHSTSNEMMAQALRPRILLTKFYSVLPNYPNEQIQNLSFLLRIVFQLKLFS